MSMSWLQVVVQMGPRIRAMDGMPRGLDKKNWLDIIYKKRRRRVDAATLSPRYPYTAIPAEPHTLTNYVGGGLDPIWTEDGDD